jgi:hypothetical protein
LGVKSIVLAVRRFRQAARVCSALLMIARSDRQLVSPALARVKMVLHLSRR